MPNSIATDKVEANRLVEDMVENFKDIAAQPLSAAGDFTRQNAHTIVLRPSALRRTY